MKKPVQIILHIFTTLFAIWIIITGGLFVVCGGDDPLSLIGWIFGFLFGIFLIIILWKSIFRAGKLSKNENLPLESIDLMESLEKTDISDIQSIEFFPNEESAFVLQTENIKRLTLYIIEKLGKNKFEPNELNWAYEHIKKYLISNETTWTILESINLMESFVRKWWEIKIVKK